MGAKEAENRPRNGFRKIRITGVSEVIPTIEIAIGARVSHASVYVLP
jgi:hypothetical protein